MYFLNRKSRAWLGELVLCPQKTACVDFSFNPLCDRRFQFYDSSLIEAVKREDPAVQEFFRLLALCHTVMPEEKSEGKSCISSPWCNNNSKFSHIKHLFWPFSSKWREFGVPGPVAWWGSFGHCSTKLWVHLPSSNPRNRHAVWDGTGRHLPAAGHTGLQQHAQENECHWLGLHLSQHCSISPRRHSTH